MEHRVSEALWFADSVLLFLVRVAIDGFIVETLHDKLKSLRSVSLLVQREEPLAIGQLEKFSPDFRRVKKLFRVAVDSFPEERL